MPSSSGLIPQAGPPSLTPKAAAPGVIRREVRSPTVVLRSRHVSFREFRCRGWTGTYDSSHTPDNSGYPLRAHKENPLRYRHAMKKTIIEYSSRASSPAACVTGTRRIHGASLPETVSHRPGTYPYLACRRTTVAPTFSPGGTTAISPVLSKRLYKTPIKQCPTHGNTRESCPLSSTFVGKARPTE
jgi:hypothetical protein